MDESTAFDQQIAREVLRVAGPSEPVDGAAILAAITATGSPKWRFQAVLSATKLVAAGVIVSLFGGFLLLRGPMMDAGEPMGSENAASTAAAGTPAPDTLSPHRHRLDADGVALSFEHAASGHPNLMWEGLDITYDAGRALEDEPDGQVTRPKDDLYISVSTHGPQGAEAMILWTTFPGSDRARPCLLDPDITSAKSLAEAMATAPGVEVVRGPSDATVGGRPGKSLALTVVPLTDGFVGPDADWEPGCDPAYFFGWEPHDGGAFWASTRPGDSIRLWVIEVDDKLLVIEVETKPDADVAVEGDIEAIIDSTRFE